MSGPSPQYNYIYSRLVSDEKDIIGIIAYARYKNQKIEWISRFKSEHNDADPTKDDLIPFHSVTNTDTAIQGYRLQAKEILDEFISNALQQATDEIEDSYDARYQEDLRNIDGRIAAATRPVAQEMKTAFAAELKANAPGFLNGVWQNVIANIVIVIATAVIILVIWSLKYGVVQTVSNALGYTVTETPAAPPAPPPK